MTRHNIRARLLRGMVLLNLIVVGYTLWGAVIFVGHKATKED